MKAVRGMVADMFRCSDCGKTRVEMAADWKGRGNGRSGESVHTATRFGGEVCMCPPAPEPVVIDLMVELRKSLAKQAADDAPPSPRTWDCRNCGARVDERIDACLLCGHERERCTSCNGTGVIDSGPHPVGTGEEPCGCDNGYYYPPAATVTVREPVHCGDCGLEAPVDDEGKPVYSYTYAKHEVPLCGPCSARRG